MQYTFFINQKRLYELGLDKQLDVIDLLLFDAIYKWFNNEDMLRTENGTTYIEIRHNLIATECPILGINHRDTFRKRMLKLVSAGLLERYQNNQTENQSLYKRGRFFNCFDSDKGVQIEIGNVPTQIGRGADCNRQGVPIEIGTNNIQNNNIQSNKYIPPLSPLGGKTKPDLSFVSPDFIPAMTLWLDYKKEKGQSYKPIGLKGCYQKLLELSSNNPDNAMAIVKQSIANNYAGLFPLKIKNDYGRNNSYNATETMAYIAAGINSAITEMQFADNRQ